MQEQSISLGVNQWEENNCDWCGSDQQEKYFDGPDRLEKLPGMFFLVRCKNCGVYRQNPNLTWEFLSQYYPDDYQSYSYQISEQTNNWRRIIKEYGNIKRRKAIETYQRDGKLLEIGCGTGGFLRELSNSGRWELSGIEPNRAAASYAREHTNAKIIQARLSDVRLENESFDAVVLWTVIEHLSKPRQDLEIIKSLIKPKGWLFFSVPNMESIDRWIFRQYWSGWDLPRHLYIFPRQAIHEGLHSLGFRIVAERCISTSYNAIGHSLEFWSQDWEHKYPRIKKLMMRLYKSWFVRAGLLVPLAILDRLNLTSTITYFAQKL